MTDTEQRAAAKKFVADWKGKGYEKGQSQPFWLALLRDVYGVEYPEQFISFEDQVHLDNTSFIDGTIPTTKVLIEQKGLGKDLKKPIKQSDGTLLTPFQQAKRYITELPVSQHPRWVVTCNFSTFLVYDMERPGGEPEEILLENLPTEYYRLSFLTDSGSEHLKREMEVSIAAGKIVGLLYDALSKQYIDPENEKSQRSLNVLCVRLVFCLYGEDAGIYGHHAMFHDYLTRFEARDLRKAVIELFEILDTPVDKRDPYLDPALLAFPYVNGGLFEDKDIEIPQFTDEIKDLLLRKASEDFDWSQISPTIFGAVFESTLNPETRRKGGMHYTSLENIHKVIDPLFLDDLKKEYEEICAISVEKTKINRLSEFQAKLASLVFFDPACGSGNFLTETYICLRHLENEVISLLHKGQMVLGDAATNPIKVSIGQFYGIEINDFAVTVAKTALWIAESQMMRETEGIVHMSLDYLPLKTYANIVEGNALRMDWETVVPKQKVSYIMGNPPFLGYSNQNAQQKADMLSVYVDEKGKPFKTAGKIDYVAAWYYKASQFIAGTEIRAAFVSTNSITNGEQVSSVWQPLFEMFGVHIDYAHRTFKWDSEATENKAAVHVVIIGFSTGQEGEKTLFSGERKRIVGNINPYLLDAPNIFVESRKLPICDVPLMITGNRPADGGHLIIEDADLAEFIKADPKSEKYIKRFMGSAEFINNKKRWCLWLVDVPASELRQMPMVMKRIEACKQDRENAPDEGRRKLAATPTLFRETNNPDYYVVVPKVSSENRRYIPIGFLDKDVIASDLLFIIPDAGLYHFGILTSNVHMAWTRAVCGRLKSDYRYSKDIVYNNFPWPDARGEQKRQIAELAEAILDARALSPCDSLADLYDDRVMPPALMNAHRELDKAVMKLYGFSVKDTDEAACVAKLMERYQELLNNAK